ncbi:ribosome-binding factor A [Hymenobacter sp. BRD67]|uniref:ribosome-binding factor A n=1 Tax=Hymenobacter sp. BRD67 TaxID=2675877 RepID=UPI00293C092F|nr:ribosome-binding factor A [Hymenobacter sp. BRD67]
MPSISTVKVTPDLAVARVYLSLLIGNDAPERLEAIKEHTKEIRFALGKRIRSQVRMVPELTFFHDDSAAYAAHMDQVLSQLDIPPAGPEQDENDEDTADERPRLFR